MSTHTLKSVARRGSMFVAAAALIVASAAPSAVFADVLNPLTERSLLLTSSAPGYQNSDGAGNSEDSLNAIGEYYAPPGSGPNGQKSGETFSFRVSSTADVKGFTLQYCTSAAGVCQAPGDNLGDARSGAPTARETNAVAFPNDRADLEINYADSPVAGTDFEIWVNGVNVSSGWTIETDNVEDEAHSGALTGKNNFIRLMNASGATISSGQQVRIVFNASETNYITNPGSGHFFVKMNTYSTEDPLLMLPTEDDYIIDGGVTVANVMTDSIHITTKVLETMAFSVGTRNRDTLALNCVGYPSPETIAAGCEDDDVSAGAIHGTCDPIQQVNNNQLQLGDADAEYSLSTTETFDVYSYWRLSSNSSGGASVYYSGDTLRNTVGDYIAEIGSSAALSTQGTEQFGLAFVGATYNDTLDADFVALDAGPNPRFRTPDLYVLDMETQYAGGEGVINGVPGTPEDATFAFLSSSQTEPVLIAQDAQSVISCDTAKMRYIANIGADTPSGVYTTKINYLAAPQY